MASILWPVVLAIVLSLTVDRVQCGVARNASYSDAKEIQNGSIPTSTHEHNTQKDNFSDSKEKNSSKHEATLENKLTISSATDPAVDDAISTTTSEDTPASPANQSVSATTKDDTPVSSSNQSVSATTAEDTPTNSANQSVSATSVEDTPTSSANQSVSVTTKEDTPVSSSNPSVSATAAEDTPTNSANQSVSATTAEDTPASSANQSVSTTTNENTARSSFSQSVSASTPEDSPPSSTNQSVSGTTHEDTPTSSANQSVSATTVEDTPTSSANQSVSAITAEDTPVSSANQSVSATAAENTPRSSSSQSIKTVTSKETTTRCSNQSIKTPTAKDTPTTSANQSVSKTAAKDTPTSSANQSITATIAEDNSASISNHSITTVALKKDEPTITSVKEKAIKQTEEDILTNTARISIPTNTSEERVPMTTNEENMQTAIIKTANETSTTEENVPTHVPIHESDMLLARSGVYSAHDILPAEKAVSTSSNEKENEDTNDKYGESKTRDSEKDSDSSLMSGPEAKQTVHEGYQNKTNEFLAARFDRLEKESKSIVDRLFTLDCSDVAHRKKKSGTATFYLGQGRRPVTVRCDMVTSGGGWTVVQRRDPSSAPVSFERGWYDYKMGFGNPKAEYWVGLQNLHEWTNTRKYELRIDMTDYNGNSAYARYRQFYVEGEDQGYRLHVSGYSGTAGDALAKRKHSDSFTADGMMFTTHDRDHDTAKDVNCAVLWKSGGWWYNSCSWSNLNGPHCQDAEDSGVGINWHTWHNIKCLRTSTMMIRPTR